MNKMKKYLLYIILLLLSSFGFAQTEAYGKIENNFGSYFWWKNLTDDETRISTSEIIVKPTIEHHFENSSIFINGSLVFDALGTRNDKSVFGNSVGTQNLSFKLNEAYYDYSGTNWALKIGRQLVQWGAADSFVVTNVICPADNTKLNGTDLSDSTNGIDAVKFSFNTDNLIVDTYFIPRFTPSELPFSKNNALYKKVVSQKVDLSSAGLGVLSINDFTQDNLTVPEVNAKNFEYGLRLSSYLPFADFSFYGFAGFEDEPFISYNIETVKDTKMVEVSPDNFVAVTYNKPTSITLSGNYERLFMLGFDSSIPVGSVTVRLDGAFYPQRHFACSAENQIKEILAHYAKTGDTVGAAVTKTQKHNQIAGVIGLDWLLSNFTISAQLYFDYVFGDTKNLEREKFLHQSSFNIAYTTDDSNLEICVSGMVDLKSLDSVIIPSVSYNFSDALSMKAFAMLFNRGVKEGLYAKYHDLSSFNVGLVYNF